MAPGLDTRAAMAVRSAIYEAAEGPGGVQGCVIVGTAEIVDALRRLRVAA